MNENKVVGENKRQSENEAYIWRKKFNYIQSREKVELKQFNIHIHKSEKYCCVGLPYKRVGEIKGKNVMREWKTRKDIELEKNGVDRWMNGIVGIFALLLQNI